MQHVRTTLRPAGRKSIPLKLAYGAIGVLLLGILIHFAKLMEETERKTLDQVVIQTRSNARDFNQVVERLERTGQNLAVQYVEDHLNRDSETAERHLIDNLHFLLMEYEEQHLEVDLIMATGVRYHFRQDDREGWSVTSYKQPVAEGLLWNYPTWETDGQTASFIQPLRLHRALNGNLVLHSRLDGLFSQCLHQDESINGIHNWWLGPNGEPCPGSGMPKNADTQGLLKNLRRMMWERREDVTTQICPWHGNHETYTSLTPVRLGHVDMAVLSTIDTGYARTQLLNHSLVLGLLFGALVFLVVFILQQHTSRQKLALQRLADERSVVETIFRSIDDLVFKQDLSGVYTDCNEAFARFFDREPDQIRGRNDEELGIGRDLCPVSFEDRLVLRRGEHVASEVWLTGPDQNRELVGLRKHPLENLQGEVFGLICVGRIKTPEWKSANEVVRMKEKLEAANLNLEEALGRANQLGQQAESANRAKSGFLASMSHEIRTPLGAIIGLSDLLAGTSCSSQQIGYVTKLNLAAHTLLQIINDILDFSKIESGRMTFEKVPFHLGETIDQVTDMFSERITARNLTFRRLREDVPDFLIGDPVRLRQILINLMGNALKFTERGSITLGVGGGQRMGEQVFLVFSVRDTGIGIPPERLEELFSHFTQADTSTTRRYGGTGLGLSICQQLTELMGGNIWVESILGEGSTFHFTLPFEVMTGEQEAAFSREMDARNEARMTAPGFPLAGLSILLVDDNEINREVISEILTQRGALVDLAENGRQAVDMVEAGEYHLVIMDMQMPVMDGPTAARMIRQDRNRRDLPILALTANALAEDRAICLEAGMDDYLAKPVDPAELETRIRACTAEADRHQPAGPDARSGDPEAAVSSPDDASSRTPGMDLDLVMRRLGSNRNLLIKLARMFLDRHAGDLERLEAAIRAGDRQRACALAHSLKGTAGNLGATRLPGLAADLENRLRQKDATLEDLPGVFARAMEELTGTLHHLLESEGPASETPPAASQPAMTRGEAAAALDHLRILCQENDTRAEDEFTQAREQFETIVNPRVVASVARALTIYDFRSAEADLEELLQDLKPPGLGRDHERLLSK